MADILERALQQFEAHLPFVIYAKPNSGNLIGFFQKNVKLHEVVDFSDKGFVFADFKGDKAILFAENECDIVQENYFFTDKIVRNENWNSALDGKEAFEVLVQKGINAIAEGSFKKVVLSRKETVENCNFNFSSVFKKMLFSYPTAFRYCWYHPEVGMWLGATPEQLLKVEDFKFTTVALAGTQKWGTNFDVTWEEKEQQEQQFVTDFIISSLESEAETLSKTKPYTFQAGNLVHLKTDIGGVFKMDFDLKKVIGILHPTPAVCGLPTEDAKAFILAEEGYERKFYAGFLGEINNNQRGDVDLFVNLRCMEVQENQVHLYIGCGITKDSNPEKEYFETANKAMTMKQIL